MITHDKLYDKMAAEYCGFLDDLKTKPSEDVIDYSYEAVFKSDILMSFFDEESPLSEEQMSALLAVDKPLQLLYDVWQEIEITYMDRLREAISDFSEYEHLLHSEDYMNEASSEVVNGEIKIDDWVVVEPNNDYGGLVGQVIAIDKLGTPEHGTENPGDDIHVSFMEAEYLVTQKEKLIEAFGQLGTVAAAFDELPLDDVIMAPDMLISLVGYNMEFVNNLSASFDAATVFANSVVSESSCGAETLVRRVAENYEEYNKSLLGFGKHEIIDMADKISAMSDAYLYMTSMHGFDDDEIEFFLQFQNPLEIVADYWKNRNFELEDMSFTMDYIGQCKDVITEQYPLVTDTTVSRELEEAHDLPDYPKGKVSFEKRLSDGKAKADEYNAQNSTATKNKIQEI